VAMCARTLGIDEDMGEQPRRRAAVANERRSWRRGDWLMGPSQIGNRRLDPCEGVGTSRIGTGIGRGSGAAAGIG
jgi:hypothetical protein